MENSALWALGVFSIIMVAVASYLVGRHQRLSASSEGQQSSETAINKAALEKEARQQRINEVHFEIRSKAIDGLIILDGDLVKMSDVEGYDGDIYYTRLWDEKFSGVHASTIRQIERPDNRQLKLPEFIAIEEEMTAAMNLIEFAARGGIRHAIKFKGSFVPLIHLYLDNRWIEAGLPGPALIIDDEYIAARVTPDSTGVVGYEELMDLFRERANHMHELLHSPFGDPYRSRLKAVYQQINRLQSIPSN